jgi:hypothetical protein
MIEGFKVAINDGAKGQLKKPLKTHENIGPIKQGNS